LSNSVFKESIGNIPVVAKSVVLAIGKFLLIVYLSLTVAPPPRVIEPPPVTPAPFALYCAALAGLAAKVNVLTAPLEIAVFLLLN